MYFNSKKLIKTVLTNFLILLIFVILFELFFGYWFDKDNLGPYMREHRMKNQAITYEYDNKTYNYNYKKNYYGFRGEDISPENIEGLVMGGSAIDERYKPEEFTITGYLNKNLKNNNYKLELINAGIEGQSTVGIIYNFTNWFSKLKNFSPKVILVYIGTNDGGVQENNLNELSQDGHVKNPDDIEAFFDNIKSKSFLYDTARIFKYKNLPKETFKKYDGNADVYSKNKFKYISYETAIANYNIKKLEKKYEKKIKNYLSRVDIIYESAKKINSDPIFITSVGNFGHKERIFILNYSLIAHCKNKKYDCIDLAKKLKGKFNYWRADGHTTQEGSEIIANLIMDDLVYFIKK